MHDLTLFIIRASRLLSSRVGQCSSGEDQEGSNPRNLPLLLLRHPVSQQDHRFVAQSKWSVGCCLPQDSYRLGWNLPGLIFMVLVTAVAYAHTVLLPTNHLMP